jgi:nickel/cobalt transporter (NicO) family protein
MTRRGLIGIGVLAGLSLAVFTGIAHAASSPFGIATPDSSGPGFGGPLAPVFIWIAVHQAAFYRALTATLAETKADGTAAWLLLGLSFLYGLFHAAGPGHGKAVITSYLLATGDSARRGIAISFAAAMVQALSAIVLVSIAAIAFRVTAMTMTRATEWMEIASYGLIVAVGAWLLWTKTVGGHHHHHHHNFASGHDHDHDHDHDRAEHARDPHLHGDHADEVHAERIDGHCVAAPPTGRGMGVLPAILAVGFRPCSGAIIILVFALSQGLFAIGVAATFVMAVGTGIAVAALATLAVSAKGLAVRFAGAGSGRAAQVVRGFEILAALAVLLLGLLLLGGALANGLPG